MPNVPFTFDFFMWEVKNGRPHVHLIAFILCLIIGIAVLRLVFRGLIFVLEKHLKVPVHILAHVFRFMPVMTGICCGIYAADNLMDLPDFVKRHMDLLFLNAVMLTVTLFVAHLISTFLQYKLTKSDARNGSTSILTTVINVAVYTVGAILILDAHGISVSPLLTALGVGGLASALALQDTLANLFSGVMTLVSKQIRIGDYIKIQSGASGRVTDMNWRNTTMRTSTGKVIIVPNKSIAASTLTNYEQPQAECTISIPLTITYGSDLDHVEDTTVKVAEDILNESQYGVTGFTPAVQFTELGDYSISLNVVLRIRNIIDEAKIRHQFIKAIYKKYQEEDIHLLERTD